MTPSYGSGDLVWDTTEATAPRWILLLDGPPGSGRPPRIPPRPEPPRQANYGSSSAARSTRTPATGP